MDLIFLPPQTGDILVWVVISLALVISLARVQVAVWQAMDPIHLVSFAQAHALFFFFSPHPQACGSSQTKGGAGRAVGTCAMLQQHLILNPPLHKGTSPSTWVYSFSFHSLLMLLFLQKLNKSISRTCNVYKMLIDQQQQSSK